MRATRHPRIWITKDGGYDLIYHARPWLLWRRWMRCCRRVTLLSRITTKLRMKSHVRGASIVSKWLRWIKALIACIVLLKWSRRVALPFFGAQRGRSPIWLKSMLDLLHILL
jgi:hypothetical protein